MNRRVLSALVLAPALVAFSPPRARRLLWFVAVGAVLGAQRADACEHLVIEFAPAADVQVAVWITDAAGTHVDTVAVTRLVATFGIGNRPGRSSTTFGGGFKSNYRWPYGKRLEVLPVWAYGRGVSYPMLIMQDEVEDWLAFHEALESEEAFFCRPQTLEESALMTVCGDDSVYTDKGMFDPAGAVVPYPPRNDLVAPKPSDSPDAVLFESVNDLDAVSMATPAIGELVSLSWDASALAGGDYLVWVEVNAENDPNADWSGGGHDCAGPPPGPGSLPCFTDCLLESWGVCLNGQPSVVWRAPFVAGAGDTATATVVDYAGYGSPTGADGVVHSPDATIASGVSGSGAGRLAVLSGPGGDFRVSVSCALCPPAPPDPVSMLEQVPPAETKGSDSDQVTIRFVHPAAGDSGPVLRYLVRYAEGSGALDETTFLAGLPVVGVTPGAPGAAGEILLTGLDAETVYTVGVRSFDACDVSSSITFVEVATDAELLRGPVSACGCRIAGGSAPAGATAVLVGGVFGIALARGRRSGRAKRSRTVALP